MRRRLFCVSSLLGAGRVVRVTVRSHFQRPLGHHHPDELIRARGSLRLLSTVSVATWSETSARDTAVVEATPSSVGAPNNLSTSPWPDLLARPLTRVTLGETATACLAQERRNIYAVHKPFGRAAKGTPQDFVRLIQAQVATGVSSSEIRRIAELFLELLEKPLHPQFGILTPWDMSEEEAAALALTVIESVMSALEPEAALEWMGKVVLGSGNDAAARNVPRMEAKQSAVYTLLEQMLTPSQTGKRGTPGKPPHERARRLLLTPQAVAIVATALFRLGQPRHSHAALDLLERAAFFRLTEHFSGTALFDEHVAVQCAEAAAKAGDSESVARLMFLLYRVKGALGSSSLSAHAKLDDAGGDVPRAKEALSSRPRQWWRGFWPFQQTASHGEEAPSVDADALFESTAIRLLKSTIRAALRNEHTAAAQGAAAPHQQTIGGFAQLHEAYTLFEALRPGTTWAGSAGMAVELLSFMALKQQEVFRAMSGPSQHQIQEQRKLALEVQVCALRTFHSVLRDATRTVPSEEVRDDVVAHSAALVMQTLAQLVSFDTAHTTNAEGLSHTAQEEAGKVLVPVFGGIATSTMESVDAATITLALFSTVVSPRHQEQLLPYALSALVLLCHEPQPHGEVLATVSQNLREVLPRGLVTMILPHAGADVVKTALTRILGFFTNTEAPAHFVAMPPSSSAGDATAVASGALLLYLSLFTSHCPHVGTKSPEATVRGDDLQGFIDRLGSISTAAEASCLHWFSVASEPQRVIFWKLTVFLNSTIAQTPHDWSSKRSSGKVILPVRAHSAALRAAHAVAERPDCDNEELRLIVEVLYSLGVQEDPILDEGLLNRILTRLLGFTVLTTPALELAHELVNAATNAKVFPVQVVVFVTASSALPQATKGAIESDAVAALGSFIERMIQPLVADTSPPAHVTFVVTGRALAELDCATAAANDAGKRPAVSVPAILLSVLRRTAPPHTAHDQAPAGQRPPPFRVVVAAPSRCGLTSTNAGTQRKLARLTSANQDGVSEARELGRALASLAPHLLQGGGASTPQQQRVALLLWNESATTANSGHTDARQIETLKALLEPRHVHLLSARRAQVEKAAHDVRAILRARPAFPTATATPMASTGNHAQPPVSRRAVSRTSDKRPRRRLP